MSLFQSLKIERVIYGSDRGKLKAELCVGGERARTTFDLPEEVSERILRLAKDAIIDAVEKSANDFIFEVTTSIPDTLLLPDGQANNTK
jgi:hypothetical protein